MWLEDTSNEVNTSLSIDMDAVGLSRERLEERRGLIGASDMPIIMGVSPYKTPYELWLEKTNKVPIDQTTNFAIDKGNAWEEPARARFSQKSGIKFEPKNFTHPEHPLHSASLDGYNVQTKEGLEIKVTGKEVLTEAKAGRIHEKYKAQVHWQMYVAGLKRNNFYVVRVDKGEDGKEAILEEAYVAVTKDKFHEDYIKLLKAKADEFWHYVTTNTAPPLSDRDEKELNSNEARKDFAELKHIKKKMDLIKAELKNYENVFKTLREQCIAHADHTIVTCEGVRLQRVVTKGSVDTSRMSEDEKNNFEKYRKKDSISYRVTLLKE